MYLQKMEVLPTPLSPTRMILYLGPLKAAFSDVINKMDGTINIIRGYYVLRRRRVEMLEGRFRMLPVGCFLWR